MILQLLNYVWSVEGFRVLDVGCGEGKNAIFLSEMGARVDAFDVSDIAIEHARTLAASKGVTDVNLSVADIRDFTSTDQYDIVIAYGLFHCLRDKTEVEQVCERLKSAVRTGGLFVLCAFNDRFQDLSAHPGFQPTTLPHDEYRQFFKCWALLECSDTDLVEVHPHNKIQHTHSMTRILARK